MQPEEMPEITPELLQQNPVLMIFILLVSGVILVGGTGSLMSWAWIFVRWFSGSALIPFQKPWRPRIWSLVDVIAIVGGIILLQIVFTGIAAQFVEVGPEAGTPLEVIALGGMASLIGVVLGGAWILLRYRESLSHIGLGPIRWSLLATGLIAGLAALPIVYLMMAVINLLSKVEYEHPLIETATESGSLTGYLMGVFAAVIAAPIAEEFVFRVVLQGWLQSLSFKSLKDSLLGGTAYPGPAQTMEPPIVGAEIVGEGSVGEGSVGDGGLAQADFTAGNQSGRGFDDGVVATVGGGGIVAAEPLSPVRGLDLPAAADSIRPPIWPSVVVGILFGLAHYQYGLSFVPLSVLGILLGLIYRQTHSVWPCILIHMMLNGFSMLMLGLVIVIMQAAG